ncbi:diguanylate cyclase domain-containing protein [Bradyrhizobium vignae]|uniref:diguanylate cyclase domain-containing protein n=1 Tax=Bradyrhizobium vignae TaxID=1549949 RepID=UPI001FE07B70|nr:diguanylate cyclase [Bradyrhizobium vignae]
MFGHPVGDLLMRAAADRLATEAEGAFVARIGGDEFMVLMPEDARREDVLVLAERLVETIGQGAGGRRLSLQRRPQRRHRVLQSFPFDKIKLEVPGVRRRYLELGSDDQVQVRGRSKSFAQPPST